MDPIVFEREFRRTHRGRAGGDENSLPVQLGCGAIGCLHLDDVRIHEVGQAVEGLHAVHAQTLGKPMAFIRRHPLFVVHEIGHSRLAAE